VEVNQRVQLALRGVTAPPELWDRVRNSKPVSSRGSNRMLVWATALAVVLSVVGLSVTQRDNAAYALASDHCHNPAQLRAWVRAKTGLEIEEKIIDVPDVSVDTVGVFDVVFFMGVFYHLKDPLLGLKIASQMAKETLIVETALDATWMRRPMMVYYPGSELADDPTNWWGPNVPLMLALLKENGFTDVSWGKDPVWRRRAHFIARR